MWWLHRWLARLLQEAAAVFGKTAVAVAGKPSIYAVQSGWLARLLDDVFRGLGWV